MYPISKANHKVLTAGFFTNHNTQLAIGLLKIGKQLLFTAEEWENIIKHLPDLRIETLIANKVWSKKTEITNDLQISITFHFGEWRIHITRPTLYVRITLNRAEWATFESLIPLLSSYYSTLKAEKDHIFKQINTGRQSEQGSLFNRLNDELKVYYKLL